MRKGLVFISTIVILLVGILGFSTYEIAFIVKATDSDFWQYTIVGGKNAEHDLGGLINITLYGPPSESDIDQQIAILENVVNKKPDAIVISSISSDAPSLILDKAYDEGIKIILIDNFVYDTKYHSFLATDNKAGGALVAETLVEILKERGKPLKGKVGIVGAMAGVQVLADRDEGFIERLTQIAPDLEILPIIYTDNDISKAANATEDLITSYDDLVAIFADNNHTGDGVARVIELQGLEEEIVVVAYDSDPQEIDALRSGAIDALIVQDPHGMGYKGVMFAFMAIHDEPLPEYFDTGIYIVRQNDMDEYMWVLDPFLRRRY